MDLEVKGIRKRYGKKVPLEDVTFSADRGSCIGILGQNGSGKSTLLSILAGIQRCDAGAALWQGQNLLTDSRLRARTVGYIPQGTPLFEELSAYDNLLLWYTKDEMKRALDGGVLDMLGIGAFLRTPVHKMSGGMKKRLSIGCAVAKKPPVLLLDEPGAALDIPCREQIAAYLTACRQQGALLILTTHDAGELALCDAWYILRGGVLHPYTYDGDMRRLAGML